MNKISAILIVYNEEKVIKRCLESLKGVADEILIVHDGKCSDKTLEIAKKYTSKIYIRPHKGRSAFHWIYLIKKAKYNWLLKLDADEFLSNDLKKNIKNLIENNPHISAFSFIWPFFNGKKYITKKWPRKTSLYRKDRISCFAFPAWDQPKINGEVMRTDFLLEHKPENAQPFSWEIFKKKALGRYGKGQAENTLKKFSDFEKYNYDAKDFPIQFRIRRKFPIATALPFAVLAFFKTFLSGGAWKEGSPAFTEAWTTFIYYLVLGYYIHKLKKNKKNSVLDNN